MKIRKTRNDERSTYRYPIDVVDGKGGYRTEYITIRPGEDGVTEANIKTLYALDDSEVYYNNKNLRPAKTDEEKMAIKCWRKDYIERITKVRGCSPSKDEVDDAVKEAFPCNWNLSLDFVIGDDESSDKSKVLCEASVSMESSNPAIERLYEVMESMTDKQCEVFRMVKLEERTLTEVAQILGTSIPNVKKHLDKAILHIRKNY